MDTDLAGIGAIMGVIGLALFIAGFYAMRKKSLIESIPTSKIRSIAMGLVEINGRVKPLELIKALFSQQDCVHYHYEIEEYQKHTATTGSGKHRRRRTTYRWVDVGRDRRETDFMLEDETAMVRIDPKGSEVDIPLTNCYLQRGGVSGKGIFSFLKDIVDGGIDDFKLNDLRHELKPLSSGYVRNPRVGDRKYKEYLIVPGDKLYVMGSAGDNPHNTESSSNVDNIIIKKGETEKFYYISDKSEREILGHLKWKMIGGISAGSLLMIASFAILLKYFHIL